MKKIYLLFPLTILLLILGCRNDIDTIITSETETPDPIITTFTPEIVSISSSVEGQVQDLTKNPIPDATVRLGNLTTQTDEYGLFSFENVTMNEKGSLITVRKEGQIDGSRRFFPKQGIISRVIIEMIPANIGATFEASAGATISINGETEVVFAPNSIANANGEIFDGEVSAIYTYLDPTASSTADRMPGNLQGIDFGLEEVALQSYGMVNVILQDDQGAPLNIMEGSTATLSVNLPTSIAADAPNEIPLWSFNEAFGIWVEEGLATKINGQYVGEVTHFSWWNCDAPFPLIELDLTLVDENEHPLAGSGIGIGFGNNNINTSYSYTNAEGFTTGKVPANITLILEIRGFCGEIISTTIIGPFTEDTSLGNIIIDDPNINNTQITGSIIDCDGNLITNGGVNVVVGNLVYTTFIDNGNFDFYISTCDGPSDLTVIGLDFDALVESEPVNGTAGTLVNTGSIEVCDNPITITESILTVTIDNETYDYSGNNLSGVVWGFDLTTISYHLQIGIGLGVEITLGAFGDIAGNYDNDNDCILNDFEADIPYSLRGTGPNGYINFQNFNLSQVSPNIIGSFSGTMINQIDTVLIDTVFVSGSFNIFQ